VTAELVSLIEQHTGRKPSSPPLVLTDTTEFFRIERDHVLLIDGRHYLVLGNAWEYRFGIDEEQKPWSGPSASAAFAARRRRAGCSTSCAAIPTSCRA
jgi:hypothetical protein